MKGKSTVPKEVSGSKGGSTARKEATPKTAQPKDQPSKSTEDISRQGVLPERSMECWRRGAQKEFQKVEAQEAKHACQQAKNQQEK